MAEAWRVQKDIRKQYEELDEWRRDVESWRLEEITHRLARPEKYPANAYNALVGQEYHILEEEREVLIAQTEQVRASERERLEDRESGRDYLRHDPPPLYDTDPPPTLELQPPRTPPRTPPPSLRRSRHVTRTDRSPPAPRPAPQRRIPAPQNPPHSSEQTQAMAEYDTWINAEVSPRTVLPTRRIPTRADGPQDSERDLQLSRAERAQRRRDDRRGSNDTTDMYSATLRYARAIAEREARRQAERQGNPQHVSSQPVSRIVLPTMPATPVHGQHEIEENYQRRLLENDLRVAQWWSAYIRDPNRRADVIAQGVGIFYRGGRHLRLD